MDSIKSAKRGGFIYTATLLLFLAVSLIGKTILEIAAIKGTAYYAVSSLFSVAVFVVAVFFSGGKSIKPLFLNKFSYKHIIGSVCLAAGMFLGLGFVNLLVSAGLQSIGGKTSGTNVPLDSVWQFLLFSVLLGVFPAVFEETFFRGVLLSNVSDCGKTHGIFTVALCFALYHLSVSQFCYQFIYGVGLAVLTLKAKSVIPAIVAHFLNNFIILSLEFFNITLDLFDPIMIGIGVCLLAVFTVLMVFSGDNNGGAHTESGIKSFYLSFGALGIALAAIITVLSALPL
ncbi:MAG: CPBP family intramembrane metalloprotease [Clostridia bacterium]|nr:CPBP family intramembrane metalloprotease [Clostridia bacterium]